MKKTMINTTHVEGLLYENHLELKESGPKSKNPGTIYIAGSIDIATNNACTNIVSVYYRYVTEKTSKNNVNSTFAFLKGIIDGKYHSVMEHGKDKATKFRIDSAIALNEFYSDRSGKEELVSTQRNEGGFMHVADSLSEDENSRSTFKCDMYINKVVHIDGDEETKTPEKAKVSGFIFNFRNEMLPVTFTAINPNAIAYFEGLEATNRNPVFTKVWGQQISEVIVKRIVEESAFGNDSVREVPSSRKDFVLTGALREPYNWGEDLNEDEVKELIANRETYLAAMKKRQDDYKASQNTNTGAAVPADTGFNF